MTDKSAAQVLRDGYQGSIMIADIQGARITMHYATSAQAETAHELLCEIIDSRATPPATTASASDGLIYESVSRRADPKGHAEAIAQIDEVVGRAPEPSRDAARPPIAGSDMDLRDLALLFANAQETGQPVTLSASACGLLLNAMMTGTDGE